jgi:predicted KAP-like P-loop ATPase
VIDALESQFKTNGERYLEKIIQVDFTVPQILESQIEELFFSRLQHLLRGLNFKFTETDFYTIWRYHGLKEFFKSIRDLNRYFNSLIFSLPNIVREINIHDFLVLEAIKVFDFNAYEKLYKDVLLHKRKAIWASISFDEGAILKYTDETTQSLLKHLFIQKHIFSGRESPNDKRIKDP